MKTHTYTYISENKVFLPLLFSITNKKLLSAIFYVTLMIKRLSSISSDIKADFSNSNPFSFMTAALYMIVDRMH